MRPIKAGNKVKRLLKSMLGALGFEVSRIPDSSAEGWYRSEHEIESEKDNELDRDTRKILNLLNYTKTESGAYSGKKFETGYHTLKIGDNTFAGQRNPADRFSDVPFDFTGATVLDIGSNQGGMIFAIADQIKFGVGIDYDPHMINAANRIKSYEGLNNVDFFVHNLEQENLALIDNFLPDTKVDIVFLLAVCMWIKNWNEVITKARDISENLLFESNGTVKQQDDQEQLLRKLYGDVTKLRDSSTDDPAKSERKLFICRA